MGKARRKRNKKSKQNEGKFGKKTKYQSTLTPESKHSYQLQESAKIAFTTQKPFSNPRQMQGSKNSELSPNDNSNVHRLIQLIQERAQTESKIARVISDITISTRLIEEAVQACREKEVAKPTRDVEGK